MQFTFLNLKFIFFSSDIPPDVLSFTITIYNKGKRSKDTEVAEVTMELASLSNGEEVCLVDVERIKCTQ